MTTPPTVEEALARVLKTRMALHLRKNLDGTFSVSLSVNNPYRKRRTIAMRGFNLAEVLDQAASQLEAAMESCEIIR